MPQYKLTYFDIRGRAEGIRYILKQAGVDFEDNRVSGDTWAAYKPKTPFGQIPVLEVDGKMLAQSCAIGRYLARAHKLAGCDDWEAARCDMIVDWSIDLLMKLRPAVTAMFGKDMEKMKTEVEAQKKEAIPAFLNEYEKMLKENGSGWFVGKNVTWADLVVAELMSRLSEVVDPTILSSHAGVKGHVEKVHALPNIKKWVETRPKNSF